GADMIGQGRDVEVNPLPGVGFALSVQRLRLAILGVKDHCQQAWPDMAARDDMERRRRLSDLLTDPASELLAHGLDHLPLPRHHLQGLSDGLAELGQLAAATRTGGRAGDYHPLARQMRRKGCPHRLSAGEGAHRRAGALRRADLVFGPGRRQFLELQLQLVEHLRPRSEDCPYCSRLSLAISSFKCATNASALEARASASCRAVRSAASAAVSAAISSRRFSGAVVTGRLSHSAKTGLLLNYRVSQSAAAPDQVTGCSHPAASGRQVRTGFRQSMPSSI